MNAIEAAYKIMPLDFKQAILKYDNVEEIRLRCDQRPSVIVGGQEKYISEIKVKSEHVLHVIELASDASIHTSTAFLRQGFLSFNGLRVGVCGHGIYKAGQLIGFCKYTSVTVRIPHQNAGMIPLEICKKLLAFPANTLIAAAPGVGKTTALREIVRYISDNGTRVALIDERGEFTGTSCSFELGRCTDVLSFVPKAEGMMFMLRAMNPQLIAMDEISKAEDIASVFDVIGCGVNVFATVHGINLQDMLHRPLYRKLLSESVFENLLTISIENGVRRFYMERICT